MSYNDYQEYQEYLERERIAKIKAEENQKLAEEEHATVMGIILFGFIAIVSTFAFFIKHPRVAIWLLVAALSLTTIPFLYKGAVALFNSAKIEGEWINAKDNPTYLPDSLIDKETCMARIEKEFAGQNDFVVVVRGKELPAKRVSLPFYKREK